MAEPLSPEGSIELLDQAVRLLRQAPFSTLICHWLGSAPLALALLLFRSQAARPRVPPSAAALYALLLTLLLIWMNCWRAVFAGRLRRQLSGAAGSPWTARRVFRLIAVQAYFGSTKLFILPLAALITFTFADTVAFYRIVAVLADGDDDPTRLRSRARRLAAFARSQNWTIIGILLLLQVVAAINFTLAIAALPQLFRILTGIETAFSRSGWFSVANPLFPLLVMAVTWLALDPFVQAVYCVRCFRAQSIETGEDVRAGLRRIQVGQASRPVGAFFCSLLFVAGCRLGHAAGAEAAVSPSRLQQAIQQTMQSHEYDWRLPPPADSVRGHSWIVDATDRAIAGLRSVFHSIGEALRAFFKWLLRQFGAMPEAAPGAPPGKALHWSVYVLIGLVLLFALWIAWQKRRARRAQAAHVAVDSLTVVRLDSEDLTPDRLPEEQWLELALRCLSEQNFRLALRAYYLANLAWLGRTGFITIHSGKTNREYELELRRRARAFPESRGLFAANVAAFERAWYGMHQVAAEDPGEFRNRMEQMKAQMKATPGAPKEAAA